MAQRTNDPSSPQETAPDKINGEPIDSQAMKSFSPIKLIIPVVIGLLVTAYLFYKEFSDKDISRVSFTLGTLLTLIPAVLLMFLRDFCNIYRFRLLTSPEHLSWMQAFRINLLCEFTSAVTPSAVGGSSLVAVFFKVEGISAGRGISVMISALFLDELFFVVACPLLFLFFHESQLWGANQGIAVEVETVLKGVYLLILLWTTILFCALFYAPAHVRRLLHWLAARRWLKRIRKGLEEFGDNLLLSSRQMKGLSIRFWLKAFGTTAVAWTSRFAVVCALLFPFVEWGDQWLVLARQLMCWIVMTVSPTPGGSGFSEYLFKEYYSDMIPGGMTMILALLWRVATYYLYLIGGFVLLPAWFKNRVLKK